jgi:hypothetical protein
MSRASWIGRALGGALVARVLDRAPAHHTSPSPSSITPMVAPPQRIVTAPPRTQPASLTLSPPVLDHEGVEWARPGAGAANADRLAEFMDRFCWYRGDHARQYKAVDKETGEISYGWARVGKRRPDDCALTRDVAEAHLRGQITAGAYLLDDEDRCRLLVLDHDDKRTLPDLDPATGRRRVIEEDGLAMLQDCRHRLEEQGIACAVSESRRGGHLFVFFDEPVPARDARALAILALGTDEVERMHRGHEAFEVYPKQDRRNGQGETAGTGSNIALPLGVHLKDGARHPFIDHHGDTVARTLSGQIDYVVSIERCRARAVLHARPWLYEELDRATHPVRARTPERTGEPTVERAVKESYPLDVMLAQYGVHAPHSGSYQCPIAGHHADGRDSTPSLSVNLEMGSGVWFCHTGNVGGDSLSLVQHMEGLPSPKEALAFAKERWPVPEIGRDDRTR